NGAVMRFWFTVLTFFVLCAAALSQVSAPKRESHWHHVFSSHRDENNLEQRYNELKCALVLIQAGNKLGTGFFISADGDVATASHVLGDRTFALTPQGTVNVSIAIPDELQVTDSSGRKVKVPGKNTEVNGDAWLADVAKFKTGMKTGCWLREAEDHDTHPGE